MSNEENHTEPELKVQISLFIPKSLKKRIAQYCIDHDTTQTVIVTEAIQDWFEKKSPAPCAARTQPVSQYGEAIKDAVGYSLFMATLTAEQRTVFKQHAEEPGVSTMSDLLRSLESSGDPRARSLASRIRQAAGDGNA